MRQTKVNNQAPDGLESRFLKPDNWQWGEFLRVDSHGHERRLRYGYVMPEGGAPDCVIVALPGLGEFGEKYFEFANECIAQNRGFFVIDWVGQGLSSRYLDNPHKRHSAGFVEDIKDFHLWITDHIKPHTKAAPLVMLAHSMGGNIGLHYLAQYSDAFSCAAFCAPMWGIKAIELMPESWAESITRHMAKFAPEFYVPGGMDWSELHRPKPGFDIFSHDPVRGALYNQWCLYDPRLQIGAVTNTWLHEAIQSCQDLFVPEVYEAVKTPFFVGVAGKDALVSNKAIRKLAAHIPCGEVVEIPDARHEVLMERDDLRQIFTGALAALVKTHT